jgi:hypothetical protein
LAVLESVAASAFEAADRNRDGALNWAEWQARHATSCHTS